MYIILVHVTKERVSRLVKMHANKREEIDSIQAGDIAAIVGVKDANGRYIVCKKVSYCS